ncbi:MAG: alkylhydroperoxidase [Betaproteobacteria bacterium]|nr:alkylhydroperoxidase [Betaproteobacteria bacterium]
MSERYPLAALESVPADIREAMLKVQEKSGFVPNVFLKLARRPAEFRAFFAYHDALMLKEGNLTKAEREMIVVATSAANQCLYCVKPLIADQIAINHRKADISPRQRTILDFAMRVAFESDTIDDPDFEMLYEHGLNDEDAWDIGAIAAFFALSNRMANLSGMMPNPEFYMLGRVPREKAQAK